MRPAQPLVSVILPVYNGADHVAEAIRSVLQQTWTNLELIVVEDGSEDDTLAIVREFARQDDRIRILTPPRAPWIRSGARARNIAAAEARGDLVAMLDHDDIAPLDRLERQVPYMLSRALDVCGGQAEVFGAQETAYWFPFEKAGIGAELCFRIGMLHSTMMFRTGVLRKHLYTERTAADDYCWQTVHFQAVTMGNHPEPLVRHRVHASQSNRVLAQIFLKEYRAYRFRHIAQTRPGLGLSDIKLCTAISERRGFTSLDRIATAGALLVRFADQDDPRVTDAMLHRWTRLCRLAPIPVPTDLDTSIRQQFEAVRR